MDMVERVARAIEPYVAVMTGNSESSGDPNFENLANWKEEAAYVARAAIAAMRYEDGNDEGILIAVSNQERVEAVSLALAWDAMIAAALGEGE